MSTAQEEFDALFSSKDHASTHPEDRDSSPTRSGSDSPKQAKGFTIRSSTRRTYDRDSSDNDSDEASPDMRSRTFLPSLRSDANTGPKGVIADAQAFEAAKKQKRYSLFKTKERSPPRQRQSIFRSGSDKRDSSVDGSGEEDDLLNDEEGFLSRWRQSRLREMAERKEEKRQRSVSRSKRVWGRMVTVDADGYLDAVEKVPRDVVVVVLIYDDQSEVSEAVEDCVSQLARKHDTTRFVKFHYEEAEMEVAGVPAIIAYRGGDKFAGLVPVIDEIPDDAELTPESLEVVLKKHQVLF